MPTMRKEELYTTVKKAVALSVLINPKLGESVIDFVRRGERQLVSKKLKEEMNERVW